MLKLKWRVFLLLLVGAMVYMACRKTDEPVYKSPEPTGGNPFFARHASTDPVVQAAARFAEGENDRYHFTTQLIAQTGYPIWDRAIVAKGKARRGQRGNADSSITVFIPLVPDTAQRVRTLLVITMKPADTSFHFLCDWQYASRVHGPVATDTTAENRAVLFMLLDNSVFGHSRFTITDSSLFADMPVLPGATGREIVVNNPAPQSSESNGLQTVIICFYSYVCGTPIWCANHGGCDYLNCPTGACTYNYTCFDFEVEGGTGGGGDGGTGGGNGGGHGAGNGGGWTPPNNPCGTAYRTALGEGCGIGWVPAGGGNVPPSGGEPIDSLLARYSKAIRDTAVFIYDNLSKPSNREYAFTGIYFNNQVTVIERTTNDDSLTVFPKVMIGRLNLLFTWHSHVSLSLDIANRGSFSPADIDMLRNVRCLKENFISFADCRNKRYALVINDAARAAAFFNSNDMDSIDKKWSTNITTGTIQDIDERRVKNVIGRFSENGISFFMSNDAPNFQVWTLLNH